MQRQPDDNNLPPGWVRSTVGEVGGLRLGRQRSPDKQSGRYPTKYIRAGNITSDGLDLSDVLEMDFDPGEKESFALRPRRLAGPLGAAGHAARAVTTRSTCHPCGISISNASPRSTEHTSGSSAAVL